MQNRDSYAAILLYHGVTESVSTGIENYSKKHLWVHDFERQMLYIREYANVVTLRELVWRLGSEKSLPEHCAVITFDDSFKNVFTVALPVLKKYQLPATFFVSTGFIDTQKMFWVDEVENVINTTYCERISLPVKKDRHEYTLRTLQERIIAVTEIKSIMKRMTPSERSETIDHLRTCTVIKGNAYGVQNYANLSWDEVQGFSNPPMYEVGGHTVNHEILSYLDDEELRFEIRECKRDIEQHLNRDIDLFSYPEGQPEHFNERVINELKSAGIRICPSAIPGFVHKGDDPFYLKRFMIGFMDQPFPFDNYRINKGDRG